MSNKIFKTFRETALPTTLEAYSIYFIAPPEKPDYVEIYVSDATGAKAKRLFGEKEVKQLLAEFNASRGQLSVVEDINGRNAIQQKVIGSEVFVKNATGDSTVTSGSARYLWDGTDWIKVSESESMDLRLTWDTLEGKPTSSITDIDNAVQLRHSHSNKTQLDKIGEDSDGNLTYGGQAVKTEWSSIGW
jgi:hypothetical protein